MNKNNKVLFLVLVGFSISLSISGQSRVEEVKASDLVWREAQTIVSGNKYLITAEIGEVPYYLQAKGPSYVQSGAVFNASTTSTKQWTFNLEEKGYLISDDSGNILYCRSGSATNRLDASATGGETDDNKYWTLENNMLKTGSTLKYTLSLDLSAKSWSHQYTNGRTSILTFYELVEDIEGEAASLAAWIMSQQDGDIKTVGCNAKYNSAKSMWNDMSSEEQELFKTEASLSAARERLANWAVANGETIEEFYTNSVQEVNPKKENNNGIIFFMLSSLMLVSGLFISKKIKVKE